MKNREIIEFIDHFCAHKENLDTVINADLAYTFLAHGYLYVRPGKPTEKFIKKVIKSLKEGIRGGIKKALRDDCSMWPLDEWIRMCVAKSVLNIARAAFDKEYFVEQIACLDADEECDEGLLDKYLNLMSKEQICDFMDDVSYFRANDLAFTTLETEIAILDELNDRCRKVNSAIPEANCFEYFTLREENPCYMFDYLSKKEIISAIKREIIFNKSLAGHMARILYSTNSVNAIEHYIELISIYERLFGKDVYKPDIFYETLYLN